jgi:hypothetical protein
MEKTMNNEMHKAIRLLNDHQLSVISTDRQVKNGTIMVQDDMLGTRYTIHSSGYARKRVFGWPNWGGTEGAVPGKENNHYQLNKTKIVTKERKYAYYGDKVFHVTFTQRILLPGEYVNLAEMVIRAANRERKNLK